MAEVTDVRVTDDGIALRARRDLPLDLIFDDVRIGSFWSRRDTERQGRDLVWAWPASLRPHLHGVTTLHLQAQARTSTSRRSGWVMARSGSGWSTGRATPWAWTRASS